MSEEDKVYETLQQLNIDYTKHEHPPVHTVEEANEYWKDIDGNHTKNIFLRNKKGSRHFLVVLDSKKSLNIKALQNKIGSGTLSFASDKRLSEHLGLSQGSVSAFGLINDPANTVEVFIDKSLLKGESISLHPNVNTATVTISTTDFKKYLEWSSNKISYIDV